MSNIRSIFEKHRTDLTQKLKYLFKQKENSNSATVGPIDNEISDTIKKIKDVETQIQLFPQNENDDHDEHLNVFVFSTNKERVRDFVTPEKYILIEPPLHGDSCEEWNPFTRDSFPIQTILETIRNKGYVFNTYYLEGEPSEDEILDILVRNFSQNIIIIDLLSLDEKSKELTARIDRDARAIITPICLYIHNDIKLLMKEIREQRFRFLDHDYKQPTLDCYHPDLSGYQTLVNTIQKLVSKNNISNRIIGGPDIDPSISSSF